MVFSESQTLLFGVMVSGNPEKARKIRVGFSEKFMAAG